jgi:hypothetical protein
MRRTALAVFIGLFTLLGACSSPSNSTPAAPNLSGVWGGLTQSQNCEVQEDGQFTLTIEGQPYQYTALYAATGVLQGTVNQSTNNTNLASAVFDDGTGQIAFTLERKSDTRIDGTFIYTAPDGCVNGVTTGLVVLTK